MKTSTTKNQMKQITTSFTKKLVALSMLATLTITIGACVAKKTESPIQKAKIQLETLGIDESKAFFVTATGTKDKDCNTWQNACDLQSAIDKAEKDVTKKFVLVAEGSYYADPNKTDVTKTFILKDGVKIYGGFDVNAKKLTRYKDASILEGKLSNTLNTKRILKGENLSATSILDGFLIQNALNADIGNSTNYPKDWIKGALFLNNSSPQLKNLSFNNNKLTGSWSYGGAIFNDRSSPSISNSTFNKNSAKRNGGAIYNYDNSSPSISNSSFSNNSAGSYGGAIFNHTNSSPSISNATFSKNSAKWSGGAIYNRGSSPNISNSTFSNNSAGSFGGAICNRDNSNPSISNATFSKNFAKYYGGAIYNENNSSPSISNASFSNNSAGSFGGAIYNKNNSSPSISNATFSKNFAKYNGGAIYNENNSSPNISNSTFSDNSANYGGAISNDNNSNPSISNASFSNNSAKYNGGAIYNESSSPKIYNSILWDNIDKHTGTEATNNIYNRNARSKPIIKNSILNTNSAVTKTSSGYKPEDYKITDPYNFMDFSDAKFKDNQAPATFSINAGGKVASASQGLIKNKGDNALYLEVYDKIKGTTGTAQIPSEEKDLAAKPRLHGSTIDIGAYELQE